MKKRDALKRQKIYFFEYNRQRLQKTGRWLPASMPGIDPGINPGIEKLPFKIEVFAKIGLLYKTVLFEDATGSHVFRSGISLNAVKIEHFEAVLDRGGHGFVHDTAPPVIGVERVADLGAVVRLVHFPEADRADERGLAVQGNGPGNRLVLGKKIADGVYQLHRFADIGLHVPAEVTHYPFVRPHPEQGFGVGGHDFAEQKSWGLEGREGRESDFEHDERVVTA